MEAEQAPAQPRTPVRIALLILLGVVLFAGFMALGTWQVHRLGWKLDLIARVNARVDAAPVPPPGPSQWAAVDADSYEYLHVRLKGHYLQDMQTFVKTSTRRGRGYWVMTPLRTRQGFIVLVNRGFVGTNAAGKIVKSVPAPQGQVELTGLLRITEPDGGFLRSNMPAKGRWYSRDVAAMAASDGLTAGSVAPYFVDAEDTGPPDKAPIGGMTVVHFRNAHLSYAITWYALGALVLVGAAVVTRFELRRRRHYAHGKH